MDSILPISHGVANQTTTIVVDMVPNGVGWAFGNSFYSFNLRNFLHDGSLYVLDGVSVCWSAPDHQIVEALPASLPPVLTLVRTRDLSPIGRGSLPIVTGGNFAPLDLARTFEPGDDLSLHTAGTLDATPDLAVRMRIRAYVQLRVYEILDNQTKKLVLQSYGESWETPLPHRKETGGSRVRLVSEGAEPMVFEGRSY